MAYVIKVSVLVIGPLTLIRISDQWQKSVMRFARRNLSTSKSQRTPNSYSTKRIVLLTGLIGSKAQSTSRDF
ncbi:hypothetical protein V1477_011706 [Vespula maculifrons]|uniref:Secreted protein n=1 Tax=Vespula maculifrons TaxID=7453 RepID=A0ABD2BZY6_VESMC